MVNQRFAEILANGEPCSITFQDGQLQLWADSTETFEFPDGEQPTGSLLEALQKSSIKWVEASLLPSPQIPRFIMMLMKIAENQMQIELSLHLHDEAFAALCQHFGGSAEDDFALFSLSLDGISKEAMRLLFPLISRLDPQELHLPDNMDAEMFELLVSALTPTSAIPRLRMLAISENENALCARCGRALASLLGVLKGLEELYFSHLNGKDEFYATLAGSLTTIRKLNLSHNWISDQYLQDLLSKLSKDLLILDMDGIGCWDLTKEDLHLTGNEGARAAARFITGSKIQEFYVRGCEITETGALALAGAFKSAPELRILCLEDNVLTDTGIIALAVSLAGSKIQCLNLQQTGIGLEGAKALALLLETTGELQRLYLENNRGLNDACVAVLAGALKESSLSTLGLSFCGFGSKGVKELALALDAAQSLTCLNLCSNRFGNEGAEHLAKVLKKSL
jgi:hypothetical protein